MQRTGRCADVTRKQAIAGFLVVLAISDGQVTYEAKADVLAIDVGGPRGGVPGGVPSWWT